MGIIKDIFANTIGRLLTFFLLFLDAIIYSLISWVYQIILVLCNIDLLSNSLEIDKLVDRIYIIIGVVVLFLVAYSLLKAMVNPDEGLKGKKSPVTIIKDVVISIVLIALVPTIFDFALGFQSALLSKNTIGKIILGTGTSDTEKTTSVEIIEEGGMEIATNILGAFLHPNYSNSNICVLKENSIDYDCSNLIIEGATLNGVTSTMKFDDFWQGIKDSNSFLTITDLTSYVINGDITYYWVISTIAGVFSLLVLIGYCFEIALRMVKLSLCELIAPLPILCRIVPGEQSGKVFNNWIKATLSIYLEVFIRLAVLFFSVFIIKIVSDNFVNLFSPLVNGGAAITVTLFAEMFVIMGILLFVRQAPEMIKDITGLDGGKFNPLKSAKQALSAIAGGVAGGSPLAAFRAYNQAGESKRLMDFSAVGNQFRRRQANREARERQEQAGMTTRRSRWTSNRANDFRRAFGMPSPKATADENFEKNRDMAGNPFSVNNDTTSDIYQRDAQGNLLTDAHGNLIPIITAGQTGIVYDDAMAQQLDEAKARNALALSRINQQVEAYQDVLDNNEKVKVKSKAEEIADKEIDKGKFGLRQKRIDASGAINYDYLELTYTDTATNQVMSFGSKGGTKEQYLKWLEAAKDHMTADEYSALSQLLKTSLNVDTREAFVDLNGYDQTFNAKNNDEIIDLKEKLQIQLQQTSIMDENSQEEGAFVSQYTSQAASTYTMKDLSDIKGEVERISREVGQRKISSDTEKDRISGQNKAIDRLQGQVKEAIEQQKASPTYQLYKASEEADKVRNEGQQH